MWRLGPERRHRQIQHLWASLLLGGVALPLSAWGFDIGPAQVTSSLGQPLRAQIQVTGLGNLPAEPIEAALANGNDQAQLGDQLGDYASTLRFSVFSLGNGRAVITVMSDEPFNEPYLDLPLRIQAGGQVKVQPVTALVELPAQRATFVAPAVPSTLSNERSLAPSGEQPLQASRSLPPPMEAAAVTPSSNVTPLPPVTVAQATPAPNASVQLSPARSGSDSQGVTDADYAPNDRPTAEDEPRRTAQSTPAKRPTQKATSSSKVQAASSARKKVLPRTQTARVRAKQLARLQAKPRPSAKRSHTPQSRPEVAKQAPTGPRLDVITRLDEGGGTGTGARPVERSQALRQQINTMHGQLSAYQRKLIEQNARLAQLAEQLKQRQLRQTATTP